MGKKKRGNASSTAGKTQSSLQEDGSGSQTGVQEAKVQSLWQVGECVSEFRLRMRDMFTQTELEEIGEEVSDTVLHIHGGSDADNLNMRRLIRAVFMSHFFKGWHTFRIQPCESNAACLNRETDGEGACLLTTGKMYHCEHYKRNNVPLLACKWTHADPEAANREDASACTIVTTKEATLQLQQHLQDSSKKIIDAKQVISGNSKKVATRAKQADDSAVADPCMPREQSGFLLLAYPRCGPTQSDPQSGQMIQHDTAVETHHYFIKDEHDAIMTDAESRMYFFTSREDAFAWADAICFGSRQGRQLSVVGVGDDMWKSYQRQSKITLMSNPTTVLQKNLGKNYKQKFEFDHIPVHVQRSKTNPAVYGSKVDLAEGAKLKGNEHFKSQRYKEACMDYDRAIVILKRMDPSDKDVGSDQWRQLLITCLSNCAECYLQLNDGQHAQKMCIEALHYSPEHVKSKSRLERSFELLSAERSRLAKIGTPHSQISEAACQPFFTMEEYFSQAKFELGICAGLAEDTSLLTKPGKLSPVVAELLLRPACRTDKLENGFLKVACALYDMAHGCLNTSNQEVLLQLEQCVSSYRSRAKTSEQFELLLFASLTMLGVLQYFIFSNNVAAVKSLTEAWEMDCSRQHPWQEFLLARAYGGLSEPNHVEAGLHHFKTVLKKYQEHLKNRPMSASRMLFADDANILVLGVHIHYETAMQHWMKFDRITCRKRTVSKEQIVDVCAKMRELRDDADGLEQQYNEECPWHPGIVYLPAREYCNKFLAEHQTLMGKSAERLERAQRERARQKLKTWLPHLREDFLDGNEGDVQADIKEISDPALQQHSLDRARKKNIEDNKQVLAAYNEGNVDAFDPLTQKMFAQTIDEHKQSSLEMEGLLAARAQAVQKAEKRLEGVIAGVQAHIEAQSHDISRVVFEQAKVAEVEFSKREQDLREDHENEMQELRTRLQCEMKKKEDSYKQKMQDLQMKRDGTHQMLVDKLQQKTSEEERLQLQEIRLEQELVSMRGELADKDKLLEESRQEVENQLSAIEAEQSAKMELEQKYAAIWSKTQMPTTWSLQTGNGEGINNERSLGFYPVHITEQSVLSALEQCLVVCCPDFLGDGSDYLTKPERPYTRLKLASAWRVENAVLMEKYMAEKRKMSADLKAESLTVPDATSNLWLHRNQSIHQLPEAQELDSALNETFLFHGTRPVTIPKIMHSGLNERVNQRGYFGSGTYLAEDAGKADQYTGLDRRIQPRGELASLHRLLYFSQADKSKPRHAGDVFYIFLCRVALGFPIHSVDGDWSICGEHSVRTLDRKYRNTNELSGIPAGTAQCTNHHSLIIETYAEHDPMITWRPRKAVKRYREFVFTHSDRTYPQYLLAVQRA